jgi:hypothetical protein
MVEQPAVNKDAASKGNFGMNNQVNSGKPLKWQSRAKL